MSVFNVNVKSHRHFQENKIKENKTLWVITDFSLSLFTKPQMDLRIIMGKSVT